MEIKGILSNNVKSYRNARGSTLVQFAKELQISKATLQKIEMTGNTTLDTVSCIAANLGISPAELLLDHTIPQKIELMEWLLQGGRLLPDISEDKRILIMEYLNAIMEE